MFFPGRAPINVGIGHPYPPALERTGPLADGLVFYAGLGEQGELGAFDAFSGLRQSSGLIHPGITPAGYGRNRTDATSALLFGFFDRYKFGTGPFTCAVYGSLIATASAYNIISNNSAAGRANQWRILTNFNGSAAASGAMCFWTYSSSASTYAAVASGAIQTDKPSWYIGVRTQDGTLQLWRDNVLLTENVGGTVRDVSGSITDPINIGYADGSAQNSTGRGITRAVLWNRGLTPADIAALTLGPDSLTAGTRIYFGVEQTIDHALTASDLAGSAPTLGQPTLAEEGHALTANNLAGSAPILGSPTLSIDVATVTVTLVNESNSPQAGLSSLKWCWFDQVTPNLFTAPTDQGSAESTDGSGVLTISLPGSSKTSGQIGWLIVTNSDGTTTQSPAHRAFSGPVAVN